MVTPRPMVAEALLAPKRAATASIRRSGMTSPQFKPCWPGPWASTKAATRTSPGLYASVIPRAGCRQLVQPLAKQADATGRLVDPVRGKAGVVAS